MSAHGADRILSKIEIIRILNVHFSRFGPAWPSSTDSAGEYILLGVIPVDYLLFAVPPTPDNRHFAPDFADDNWAAAERISVTSRVQSVNLKVTIPE